MSKHFYFLLIAQFLSAFADNAILFTVIALVMHSDALPSWYVPALQSSFLVAFVVLAPWSGRLADCFPKARILLIGNLIKALGAVLLLLNTEALLAYGVVGAGAALYSPAKYGILPELARHDQLVKANSWIEGSTILAILSGMMVGAKVADYSIIGALILTIVVFALSALSSLALPLIAPVNTEFRESILQGFVQEMRFFLDSFRAKFCMLGAAMFWATAATLRVIIVAWAPLILHSHNASDIATLTLFLALGIIAGSVAVPNLISLETLQRAKYPAYLMGLMIILLSFTDNLWASRAALFGIGTAGGIFIVPLNAAIQELGKQHAGSGMAVAIQNFYQNAAMLLAVGIYTYVASIKVSPLHSMLTLGALVLVFTASIGGTARRARESQLL